MAKKIVKITALALATLVGAVVLAVVIYVIYVCAQYYRIEDGIRIEVENEREAELAAGGTYTIATYNIGFGAYDHGFSFFMDSGEMKDGTKVHGTGSKASSRQAVLDNTNGALALAKGLDADFLFFQEVDTDSTRSHGVDQYEAVKAAFGEAYSASYAVNFHSAFLFYPIFDPHGTANAGLATLSRYRVTECVRYSFPVDGSFPTRFFDLDRCFSLSRVPVADGRELVLVHQHMSAYDEGGKVRAKQLELLASVMREEYAKGNYVIVGGDFNHVLTEDVALFPSEQKVPEWVHRIGPEDLPEGFSVACGENAPTCRSSDMPYTRGKNYTAVLDGFLVSDNLSCEVTNVDADFAYSDHDPALMTFRLL